MESMNVSELLYVAYFEILKCKPSKDTLRYIITLDLLEVQYMWSPLVKFCKNIRYVRLKLMSTSLRKIHSSFNINVYCILWKPPQRKLYVLMKSCCMFWRQSSTLNVWNHSVLIYKVVKSVVSGARLRHPVPVQFVYWRRSFLHRHL